MTNNQPKQILLVWTIYDHPKDYNDSFVARKFLNDKATTDILVAPTLEELRKVIQKVTTYKLIRIKRNKLDDPFFVESWI